MGFLSLVVLLQVVAGSLANDVLYYENYAYWWGWNHITPLNQGRELQLSLDQSSGAGFLSDKTYGSGFFHMNIRLPSQNDTAGVLTTFYLTSGDNDEYHDELDFEFLGSREGEPILLQTNIFANGKGNREQRITLWFDPRADYHDYKILWNHRQIVFYVDDTPIRVFKNKKKFRVPYPSQPMQIRATLWQADWAGSTNWNYAPFLAYYQGFDVSGCPNTTSSMKDCYGKNFWWNRRRYRELSSDERAAYENVRNVHMQYDYCTAPGVNPNPSECTQA